MASKANSRWADTEEDVKFEAKRNQEKEAKRQKKVEKARQLEEQAQAARDISQRTRPTSVERSTLGNDEDNEKSYTGPQLKRRKLLTDGDNASGELPAKLPRYEVAAWTRSRSVENYDKLNDIEEGTYGWVARATENATGQVVALKRLKLEPNDRNGLPVTGLREMQILRDCEHRNIVRLREVVVGSDTSRPDKYGHISTRAYASSCCHD